MLRTSSRRSDGRERHQPDWQPSAGGTELEAVQGSFLVF